MNVLKRTRTLAQSFTYAAGGLRYAFSTQRNLRLHTLAALLALAAGLWLRLETGKLAAVVVASAVVISAELFNTSLEALVDLTSGGRLHELARQAKDVAAAAVLVTAAAALVVGALVLIPPALDRLGIL
ncbi:MAG: diacylglycerol kinase [Firmicutes bacterium]|nr:diacylglycerol kinase [Bacillota bacterium]